MLGKSVSHSPLIELGVGMNYNIIMLDMDGVLNSEQSRQFYNSFNNSNHVQNLLNNSSHTVDEYNLNLCPIASNNLSHLLLSIENPRIVISSTWRKKLKIEDFNKLFSTVGITKEHTCLDCNGQGGLYRSNGQGGLVLAQACSTCNGTGKNPKTIPFDIVIDKTDVLPGEPRGDEIELWVNNNQDKINKFIILDDEKNLGIYTKEECFIQTDFNLGLTIYNTQKAIDYFNK